MNAIKLIIGLMLVMIAVTIIVPPAIAERGADSQRVVERTVVENEAVISQTAAANETNRVAVSERSVNQESSRQANNTSKENTDSRESEWIANKYGNTTSVSGTPIATSTKTPEQISRERKAFDPSANKETGSRIENSTGRNTRISNNTNAVSSGARMPADIVDNNRTIVTREVNRDNPNSANDTANNSVSVNISATAKVVVNVNITNANTSINLPNRSNPGLLPGSTGNYSAGYEEGGFFSGWFYKEQVSFDKEKIKLVKYQSEIDVIWPDGRRSMASAEALLSRGWDNMTITEIDQKKAYSYAYTFPRKLGVKEGFVSLKNLTQSGNGASDRQDMVDRSIKLSNSGNEVSNSSLSLKIQSSVEQDKKPAGYEALNNIFLEYSAKEGKYPVTNNSWVRLNSDASRSKAFKPELASRIKSAIDNAYDGAVYSYSSFDGGSYAIKYMIEQDGSEDDVLGKEYSDRRGLSGPEKPDNNTRNTASRIYVPSYARNDGETSGYTALSNIITDYYRNKGEYPVTNEWVKLDSYEMLIRVFPPELAQEIKTARDQLHDSTDYSYMSSDKSSFKIKSMPTKAGESNANYTGGRSSTQSRQDSTDRPTSSAGR